MLKRKVSAVVFWIFLGSFSFAVVVRPLLAQAMGEGTAAPLFPAAERNVVDAEIGEEHWQFPSHEHVMVCCDLKQEPALAPALSSQSKAKDFSKIDQYSFRSATRLADVSGSLAGPPPGEAAAFLFSQRE